MHSASSAPSSCPYLPSWQSAWITPLQTCETSGHRVLDANHEGEVVKPLLSLLIEEACMERASIHPVQSFRKDRGHLLSRGRVLKLFQLELRYGRNDSKSWWHTNFTLELALHEVGCMSEALLAERSEHKDPV